MKIKQNSEKNNINISALCCMALRDVRKRGEYKFNNALNKIQNYYPYIPSCEFSIMKVFEDIYKTMNTKDLKFIDIGAGNDVILNIAKILGFDICRGLEYNDKLIELNSSNTLIKGDLLDYDFKDYDVLYSYNPIIDSELMLKGIKNIINTMSKNSVFYFNNANIHSETLKVLGFIYLRNNIYKFTKLK